MENTYVRWCFLNSPEIEFLAELNHGFLEIDDLLRLVVNVSFFARLVESEAEEVGVHELKPADVTIH